MKRLSFSLIEIIIIVAILGILIAVAIPKFQNIPERARATRAVNILGAIRKAQNRYALENGFFSSSFDELDIEISTEFGQFQGGTGASKYFSFYLITSGNPNDNQDDVIASASRNDIENTRFGNYKLSIKESGEIECTDGSDQACRRLGY